MNGGALSDGSFSIGRLFGITLKLHWLFLLIVAWELMAAREGLAARAALLVILFGSVLLHELGHCLGARLVGGSATEIILWPLGGLSRMRVPNTAKAEFISTVLGPVVNLLLAAAGLGLLAGACAGQGLSVGQVLGRNGLEYHLAVDAAEYVFWINALLCAFNVLPAYPMDGGRLLRSVLWLLLEWRTATLIASGTALGFGLLFVGLALFVLKDIFLGVIGALVLMASWQELQRARAYRPAPRSWDDLMPHERP